MKKLFLPLAIILVLTTLTFYFLGCQDNEDDNSPKDVTLLIVDKDMTQLGRYEREAKGNLIDLFNLIAQEQDSTFSFESNAGFLDSVTVETHPKTLESVGLFPDFGKREFIAMYHTIDTPQQRLYEIDVLTYENTKFYGAANGLDTTPLVDGVNYLITIASW